MQRLLFVLAAALMLGGCNMVYAEQPLFTAADAAGAPVLRPGIWSKRASDCVVDAAKPISEWPECADPVLVTADRIGDPGKPDKQGPYLLAGGDPRVMQMELKLEPDKPAIWIFVGLRPLRTDAQGRITEARTWMVQCGPPPPPRPEPAETPAPPANETPEQAEARIQAEIAATVAAGVTREPLPGLEIKEGMCIARDRDPVRNAASASLAWDDGEESIIYWVRDGAE